MADDFDISQTITVSVEDDTKSGLQSLVKNFTSSADALGKALGSDKVTKPLADGAKKHSEEASKHISKVGETLKALSAGRLLEGLELGFSSAARGAEEWAKTSKSSVAGVTASMLGLGEAVAGIGVAAGLEEVARHSFTAGAAIDRQYTILQNRMQLTTEATAAVREEMEKLATATYIPLNQLTQSFDTFMEKLHRSPDEAVEIFPLIAKMARGLGADLNSMSAGVGTMLHNFNIAKEDAPAAMAIINDAIEQGHLNVDSLNRALPQLSQRFEDMGYKGEKGLRMMMQMFVELQPVMNNTRQTGRTIINLFDQLPAVLQQIHGGTETYWKAYVANAKSAKDVLKEVIDAIKATHQPLERFFGGNVAAIRTIVEGYDAFLTKSEKLKSNTEDIDQNFKRMMADNQASVERLGTAWEHVEEATMRALVAIKVPEALQKIADLMDFITHPVDAVNKERATPKVAEPGAGRSGYRELYEHFFPPAQRHFGFFRHSSRPTTPLPGITPMNEGQLPNLHRMSYQPDQPEVRASERQFWEKFWRSFFEAGRQAGTQQMGMGAPRVIQASYTPGAGGGGSGGGGGGFQFGYPSSGGGSSASGSGGAAIGSGGGGRRGTPTPGQSAAPSAGGMAGTNVPADASTMGGANVSAVGGSDSLAAARKPIMDELDKDPGLRHEVHQMMATEGGGHHGQAALESAVNRVMMIRKKVPGYTLRQELHSGFYGPFNKGIAQRRRISDREARQFNQGISNVKGGSNLIQGRTDQGTIGDPNANGPGRVSFPGMSRSEIYNYWHGSRRHQNFSTRDSANTAAEVNRLAAMPSHQPTATASADTHHFGGALQQMHQLHRMKQELEKPITLKMQHSQDNRMFARTALNKATDRNWRNARMNSYADLAI